MIKLKLLVEESLSQININRILNKTFLKNAIIYASDYAPLFYQFKDENNIEGSKEDFDSLDDNEKQDFYNWYAYELQYKVEEYIKFYKNLLVQNHNKIKVYRRMMVNKDWISKLNEDGTKLGIYWTFDKEAAEPHWGYNKASRTLNVMLATEVGESDIDWKGTLIANLEPSTGKEEKEIRLEKRAKIRLLQLWIDEKEIKLNKKIKSNIYLA